MDILLTHGYFLYEDPVEKKVMKPYPPLGILYLSAYLKIRGFQIEVLDTTFRKREDVLDEIRYRKPPVVGIYCNLMTKMNVLTMLSVCKEIGATVILGGPEPAEYASEYLDSGADIIAAGEGELVLEALLQKFREENSPDLSDVAGIFYRDDNGICVKTSPGQQLQQLDDLPFPDRDAIDIQQYMDVWKQFHDASSLSVLCARGCPYTCTWCSHSVSASATAVVHRKM